MNDINTVPVDGDGMRCGRPSAASAVDNGGSHEHASARATCATGEGILRFHNPNTTGCDAGFLSFTKTTKQLTS